MKLPRLTIALYVTLIFASGIVVGAFGHRLYTVNTVAAKTSRNPEEWRKRYTAEMQNRLGLDAQQLAQLNTILDDTRKQFDAVHLSHRPEIEAIKRQQVEKIRTILTDQQRAEYEKMREERKQHLKK